jgi:hypothetical protein
MIVWCVPAGSPQQHKGSMVVCFVAACMFWVVSSWQTFENWDLCETEARYAWWSAMDSQMEHLGQIMFVEPDFIQETRYVCELKV